jgi:hypothetical protein
MSTKLRLRLTDGPVMSIFRQIEDKLKRGTHEEQEVDGGP